MVIRLVQMTPRPADEYRVDAHDFSTDCRPLPLSICGRVLNNAPRVLRELIGR